MLMMMRADENANIVEGCTAEELLACIAGDNYDECVASCGSEEEPTLPGYATVTTRAESNQTVALNAVDKKIGTVTLKAGENDTTVTALEITKSGLGQAKDVLNVQLMKNGEYVSNQATLNNNIAKLRFRPNLVLKANSSETFDVVVSMNKSGTAGGIHNFAVTSVVVSNGTFGGTPANLGSLTTSNYLVKEVVADVDDANVSAGDEDVTISTVTLNAKSDAKIDAFTLTSEGNEEGLYNVFSNVKAYIDNVEVGTVSVNEETITVKGLNKDIEKNDDLVVVLRGDVIYVGNNDYFDLTLKDNHVVATETNTAERMPSIEGTDNEGRVSITNKVGLTLKNLTKDAKTVAINTKEVELLNLELSSAANLDVKSYYVDFGTTEITASDLENIVLSIDGNDTDIEISDIELDAGKYVATFNDNISDVFSVAANDKMSIKVTADVKTARSYELTFGVKSVKNTDTNTTVNSITSAYKGGHTTVVKPAGSISVVKLSSAEGTTIKGGEPTDILAWSIKAKSEDVTLNTVDFELNTTLTSNDIDTIELYQGTTKLDSLDGDKLTGTPLNGQFKNLSKIIKVDETLNFTLRITLATTAVSNLGKSITANISIDGLTLKGKTSKATIHNTTTVPGKEYQLSTSRAALEVSQSGKYITVTVNNNSAYDMVLDNFVVDVEGEMIDGENMMDKVSVSDLDLLKDNRLGDSLISSIDTSKFSAVPGELIAKFKNNTNPIAPAVMGVYTAATSDTSFDAACTATSVDVSTDTTAEQNRAACENAIVTPAVLGNATYPVISNGDSMTFVIEMKSTASIKDTYYNAIAKELSFYYVEDYNEGDEISSSIKKITEKFNENK